MVLNIVKNDLPASCIAEYVRCVFDNAKVNIKMKMQYPSTSK